jgi:hypothetical protein
MADSTSTLVPGLFEEVTANATGAAADQFYVSFSQEIRSFTNYKWGHSVWCDKCIKE